MPRGRLIRRIPPCLLLGLLTTWCVAAALANWISTANAKWACDMPMGYFGEDKGLVSMTCFWAFGTERRKIGWWPVIGYPAPRPFVFFPYRQESKEVPNAPVRTDAWGVLSDMTWEEIGNQRDGAEEARGLPLLAFWWWAEPDPIARTYTVHGGIPVRTDAHGLPILESRILPLLPIWRGLIIDTLFYGLIWMALVPIPGLLVARRRRRRGLCPKCAYDLRGDHNAGCPECGWRRSDL